MDLRGQRVEEAIERLEEIEPDAAPEMPEEVGGDLLREMSAPDSAAILAEITAVKAGARSQASERLDALSVG